MKKFEKLLAGLMVMPFVLALIGSLIVLCGDASHSAFIFACGMGVMKYAIFGITGVVIFISVCIFADLIIGLFTSDGSEVDEVKKLKKLK